MHVTELTEGLISELREYVEITPDGHILTKKTSQNASRVKVGKRRGAKSKQGMRFSFVFQRPQNCYPATLEISYGSLIVGCMT